MTKNRKHFQDPKNNEGENQGTAGLSLCFLAGELEDPDADHGSDPKPDEIPAWEVPLHLVSFVPAPQ